MKNKFIISVGLITLFLGHAQANDFSLGKELFNDANCMSCHTSKPFQPDKTTTFLKLVKAIDFCNINLNTGWFEDEIEEVAAYLNDKYYHHPK